MYRKILVLLDSLEIRKEVTSYSIELALRMAATLDILMILRLDGLPSPQVSTIARKAVEKTYREGERVMGNFLKEIRLANVDVHGTVRQGDPASELLKYLAESRPFELIVWGGNEQLLRRKKIPVRNHWLGRIRKTLECPLVVPSIRGEQR